MSGKNNIVFIVFDTMRSDSLSVYNGKSKTPNFDKLANESIVFTNNISAAPWTIPSHASLFTGKYPMEHKVRFNDTNRDFIATSKLMNEYKGSTLAEALHREGYSTYGLSANTGIIPGSGFDRGFDIFTFFDPMGNYTLNNEWSVVKQDIIQKFGETRNEVLKNMLFNGDHIKTLKYLKNYFKLSRDIKNSYKRFNFPMNKSGEQIIDTIQRSSFSEPFFLFINFMEFHEPYVKDFNTQKEQEYSLGLIQPSQKVIEDVRLAYYKEAEKADWELGQIIKFLKYNNIYDNTALVLTSDHGQSLFEHGFYGHGIYLHDELIKVPLIIKEPKFEPLHETMNKLFSSTGLYDIIRSFAHSKEVSIPNIPFVLSEADGSWKVPSKIISKNDLVRNRLLRMDSRRLAIFKDDFKLIINGKDGKLESFEMKGEKIRENEYNEVIKDLVETINIVGWK